LPVNHPVPHVANATAAQKELSNHVLRVRVVPSLSKRPRPQVCTWNFQTVPVLPMSQTVHAHPSALLLHICQDRSVAVNRRPEARSGNNRPLHLIQYAVACAASYQHHQNAHHLAHLQGVPSTNEARNLPSPVQSSIYCVARSGSNPPNNVCFRVASVA
jgi:hypothetical protein